MLGMSTGEKTPSKNRERKSRAFQAGFEPASAKLQFTALAAELLKGNALYTVKVQAGRGGVNLTKV